MQSSLTREGKSFTRRYRRAKSSVREALFARDFRSTHCWNELNRALKTFAGALYKMLKILQNPGMSGTKKMVLFLGDIAILYLSLAITITLRYNLPDFKTRFQGHFLPFSLIFVVWLLIFYLLDLYYDRTLKDEASILQALTWAILISGTASIIAFYLLGGFFSLTPKTNLLIFAGIFLLLDYLWRSFMVNVFSSGAWGVGIFGTSPLIEKTVEYVEAHPHTGYKITAWKKSLNEEDFRQMVDFALQGKIKFLIAEAKLTHDPKVLNAMYRLLPLEMGMMHFSDFYEAIFGKVPLSETEERWFIEHIAVRRTLYDVLKAILDFSLALLSGIILLPFAIIIAVFIKLTSRGPIIYKSERIGKNGKPFTIYKFRTMTTWKGGEDGTPAWTEENDSRITRLGKFLRYTHLDEMPQLWNILKGDLSVTGPRPEHSKLVEQYQKFPFYEIRHLVKPGLTGWAQVKFRPSASLEEAREKLEYDIYYVKNRSFLLDILIIIRTLRYIFTGHK
jgi:exopolysaccharide biosynthesis polyprenyl glycosylphosphotransferase